MKRFICLVAIVLNLWAVMVHAVPLVQQVGAVASGVTVTGETRFAMNMSAFRQLRLQQHLGEFDLPTDSGQMIALGQLRQLRQDWNTSSFVSQAADKSVLLTLGSDHFYGRIRVGKDVYMYEPGTEPGSVVISKLDPAFDAAQFADMVYAVPAFQMPTFAPKPEAGTASENDGKRIDVMVLYTPGIASKYSGTVQTKIQSLLDYGNLTFANSKVDTSFALVHSAPVNYPDDSPGDMGEALDDLTENIGVFSNVEALRDQYYADQVVLLRTFVDEACGLAWVLNDSSPGYAYAVVHTGQKTDGSGWYCEDATYTHEIGHNLGCVHDRNNSSFPGRDDWSYGYQDPAGEFRTLMAYNCPGGCSRVEHIANPAIMYKGKPTGINYLAADSADCARTINVSRIEMARYRLNPGATPPPPTSDVSLVPTYLLLLN